ncbi:MAG TPA: TIGR01777 family oxidoreductase [Acidimicrobiia bacterium]
MRVLVTGSTGFIGSALVSALEQRGDKVVRLGRGGGAAGGPTWDPKAGTISTVAFDGVDAVVHLAGEGIGEKKWTPEQKRRILESRTKGTALLARTLADLPSKPAVLVSGSAIGYYGDRGDETLDETSTSGDDFLAGVCREWEAAAQPAADAGIRVVTTRTGIVLAPQGGVLKRLLTPFRFGLGGRVGSGRQWMSWIAMDDVVGAILHALDHDTLRGPVNLTAPNPVTNAELTKKLGAAVHRPTVLPTPLLPLKLVYGSELVAALLVGGQRVLPRRLTDDGYVFARPELAGALRSLLGAA